MTLYLMDQNKESIMKEILRRIFVVLWVGMAFLFVIAIADMVSSQRDNGIVAWSGFAVFFVCVQYILMGTPDPRDMFNSPK